VVVLIDVAGFMAKPDASGAEPVDGKRKSPSGARAADSARAALPHRMEGDSGEVTRPPAVGAHWARRVDSRGQR
jgi:hypothetical protein